MSEYTDGQLLEAIGAALHAVDHPAVVSLLHMLAVQAPDKAQIIYDAITTGVVNIPVRLR